VLPYFAVLGLDGFITGNKVALLKGSVTVIGCVAIEDSTWRLPLPNTSFGIVAYAIG
jgi:hypothetical protein